MTLHKGVAFAMPENYPVDKTPGFRGVQTMSTFRAGGLMSGLDTNSIIEQLMALERIPIQKLQKRQDLLTSQKSLFGEINSALGSLKSTMEGMDTDNEILSYGATSSNEDAMTVTASGEAVAGTHTVKILQSAKAEQDRSVAFSSDTDAVKAGTLTISVQGEDDVDVTIEDGTTLSNLAYAINRSGAKVSATVINTGTEYYLAIYAKDTGYEVGTTADDAVVLTESYTGSTGTELGLTQTVQAQNAQMEFDGLTVERRSNIISDVIPGLSMNIVDATGQPTVEVAIEPDKDGLKENLQKFVDSYNKVLSMLSSQFKVGADQSTGILFGDGTLRGLMMRLQTTLSDAITGAGGNFSTLGEVGISSSSDGSLSINESDLSDAMDEDFKGIASLFTTADTGVIDRLTSVVEDYTDSVSGIIKQRQEGLDDRYDNLETQIERMELRLDAYERQLVAQFTALETTISQLKGQQSSLSSLGGG